MNLKFIREIEKQIEFDILYFTSINEKGFIRKANNLKEKQIEKFLNERYVDLLQRITIDKYLKVMKPLKPKKDNLKQTRLK